MGRIIIFTGKGGVGKTSVAAAHAQKASDMGHRVLLVSVDMAHNLSDIFRTQIGKEITKVHCLSSQKCWGNLLSQSSPGSARRLSLWDQLWKS